MTDEPNGQAAPVFHIGLPRTGTTTLQRHLFSDPSLFCTGYEQRFWNKAGIGAPLPDSQIDIRTVKQIIEDLRSQLGSSRRLVFSNEGITSTRNILAVQQRYAERMKALHPSARVILTLRRQETLLRSRYTQMSKAKLWNAIGLVGPTQKFAADDIVHSESERLHKQLPMPRFEDWIKIGAAFQDHCWFSMLNYADLYSSYADTLGAENVKVLFFEDLVSDRGRFARELAEFIRIPVEPVLAATGNFTNVSPTGAGITRHFRRKSGKKVMSVAYVIRRLFKLDGMVEDNDQRLRALVKENWASQNKALSARLGEDLESRGYAV